MKDKLIQDSITVANTIHSNYFSNYNGYWIWISLVEFLIILSLLIYINFKVRSNIKTLFKQEAISKDVDFDNVINSAFHSISLYDKLKIKCHPDLFAEDESKSIHALSLFQEITRNKTNLKRLEELKKEAENKLGIII